MDIKRINSLIQKEKRDGNISVKEISDGHHTFGDLYKNRLILFCSLCNCFPELSWKSRKHFDNENDPMFNGCFIAGINTPKGVATYHFKLEYWDLFEVPEIDRAPKYNNYTNEEVMNRVLSLSKSLTKQK